MQILTADTNQILAANKIKLTDENYFAAGTGFVMLRIFLFL